VTFVSDPGLGNKAVMIAGDGMVANETEAVLVTSAGEMLERLNDIGCQQGLCNDKSSLVVGEQGTVTRYCTFQLTEGAG
jgi:hypothetical protein